MNISHYRGNGNAEDASSTAPHAASGHGDADVANVVPARGAHEQILFLGFNQDFGCFACGTKQGFCIYNTDPFQCTHRRDFSTPGGGIGWVEMLYRTNILAIVGGGPKPYFPMDKVMLWDDHSGQCIGELSFSGKQVMAVRMRRDMIVVVLETEVYVYGFEKLNQLHKYDTADNRRGLGVLSATETPSVLACPSSRRGQVRVEFFDQHKTKFIDAHDGSLSQLAMTLSGHRIATASTKGTLIRIFDTATGDKLHELRRGADRAVMYSIAFSPDSKWLACSSDKGTVHVFRCQAPDAEASSDSPDGGKGSRKSFMSSFLPRYFQSEWSHAKFRGPDTPTIVSFVQTNAPEGGAASESTPEYHGIVVVGADGSYFRCRFDPDTSGDMANDAYQRILDPAIVAAGAHGPPSAQAHS